MLIMQPTNVPFQDLADKIAREFFVKGASLEDSIVEEAKNRALKPEEVKRLVEKSNTAASILYLKSSEDKKGSFTLAKKEDVLKRTHPTASEKDLIDAETAEDANEAAASERTGLPESRKVASRIETHIAVLKKQAESNDEITVHDIFAARARLDELKQIKAASEMRLQDILHDIIDEYQYKSADALSKLASDAAALYGAGALAVIDTAAEYLKKCISLEKSASNIIDDSTHAMQLLKQASTLLESNKAMAKSITDLDAALMKNLPESFRASLHYVNPMDNTYSKVPGVLFDTLKRNNNVNA